MTLRIPKKRLVLTCNSHSLSDYQMCEERYRFSNIVSIEPDRENIPFSIGTLIHSILAAYYRAKKEHKFSKDFVLELKEKYIDNNKSLDDEQKNLLGPRLLRYAKHYSDETWIPKAVESEDSENQSETGFSRILYEDDYVLFVYEGEPDLIISPGTQFDYLAVVDHKSQSRRSDLFEFSNQFRGYCWATQTNHLVVNYFGLQKTGESKEWFRRKVINFSQPQLDAWRIDTIKWYYKILFSIKNHRFERSWQCEGKYGVCQYIELCRNHHLDFVVRDKMKREFKEKERKQSWT